MIPVAAYLAAGALVVGAAGGWAANGWRLGSTIAKMEAEAFRMAAEARATETRWAEHVIKIGEDANAEAEKLRAALARASTAGRGLHDTSIRVSTAAASAPGTSDAAAAAIRLYAELYRELDEFAGEASRAAGESRGAGETCVRADEVTR